jgi:hypothetical protein
MKKAFLKLLLLVLGLNVFTACYGAPPAQYQELPDVENTGEEAAVVDEEVTDEAAAADMEVAAK